MTEEGRYCDTAEDRIPQEKGLLRRTQETKQRAERIKSLVYEV
jgi:hypothetical protein